MPVIKLWCLPLLTEAKLRKLHQDIVRAVVSVTELGLKTQNDMTVLFPTDMMKYGLGEEVIVEVTGLFARRSRTPEVRARLANHLGRAVQEHVPQAMIEVFVTSFKPEQGFWTSKLSTIDQAKQLRPDLPPGGWLHCVVMVLGLSVRSSNCLQAGNVLYLRDLVLKTEFDLVQMGLIRKEIRHIKQELAIRGLALAG